MAKAAKKAAAGAENCYGCGQEIPALEHPSLPANFVVGIMNEKDVEGDPSVGHPTGDAAEDGENYVGVKVCLACHKDPAHRSVRQLKCHFFEPKGNSVKMALMMAGSYGING